MTTEITPPKEMQPWCQLHEAQIHDMRKTLYGNGREGIVSKVERNSLYLKAIMALLAPCFIAAVGLISNFIIHLVTGN